MGAKDSKAMPQEGDTPDPFASLDDEIRTELEYYLSQPESWKKDLQGKFAVIKNREIHKVFESRGDAYAYALEKFGNTKFLIQQIGAEDTINYTTQALLGAV
ncbi:hypothetical protein HQ563_03635 [bacterium]|nr:hypothetical protein [bacterium]